MVVARRGDEQNSGAEHEDGDRKGHADVERKGPVALGNTGRKQAAEECGRDGPRTRANRLREAVPKANSRGDDRVHQQHHRWEHEGRLAPI